jgi:hypothetical protein
MATKVTSTTKQRAMLRVSLVERCKLLEPHHALAIVGGAVVDLARHYGLDRERFLESMGRLWDLPEASEDPSPPIAVGEPISPSVPRRWWLTLAVSLSFAVFVTGTVITLARWSILP